MTYSTEIVRSESWGRLVYDTVADEFEAHVRSSGCPLVDRPISVGCLVTGRCNLECGFCYGNREALPTEELSVAEWHAVFRNLRSLGVMRVDLSGGEPTIRKDLPQIAAAALDARLNVVVSTNGTLLTGERLDRFPAVRWHVSLDSGAEEVHEASRQLRCHSPSKGSFNKTTSFILECLQRRLNVRVLTCLGPHNHGSLFALAEHLALLGVLDWNISRILPAGRALPNYEDRWAVSEDVVTEQIHDIRSAFGFMRIRYSSRQHQSGYFLLALPDGFLATQMTDGRDKVRLGPALTITLPQLRSHGDFSLSEHCEKWISQRLDWQPFHHLVSPELWDAATAAPLC
jgi:MoaA/NifB/PqqE/SkfB family radical SAM enzyme